MLRAWFAAGLLLLMSAVSAQEQNQPADIVMIIDDSFGVSESQWTISLDLARFIISGSSSFIIEDTWRLSIVTFSGRVIRDLVEKDANKNVIPPTLAGILDQLDSAAYIPASASAQSNGFSAATQQISEYNRGVASLIFMLPSDFMQYSRSEIENWSNSVQTQYKTFRLWAGVGVSASSASFYRSAGISTDPDFYIETSYAALTTNDEKTTIIEQFYRAIREAEAPDSPRDCLPLDVVFVIDETAASFVEDIKQWLLNIVTNIVNIEREGVLIGIVTSGSDATFVAGLQTIFNSDNAKEEISNLNINFDSTNNLANSLDGVRAFFDQLEDFNLDRSIQTDVLVMLTYREPNMAGFEAAIASKGFSAARIIAVGVETSEVTLNDIATVTAWRTMVPNFQSLPDVALQTSNQICSAGIPVCFYSADVVMVVDAGSVFAQNNWNNIRLLMRDIAASYFYGYNGVRIAVVLYGANAEIRYTLEDSVGDRYPKLSQFTDQLEALRPLSFGSANPAAAFRLVREEILGENNSGDRVAPINNVVLWIPSSVTNGMRSSLQQEVAEFRALQTAVGVVGLGLNSEGISVATEFTSSIAAGDLTYFVDFGMLSTQETRVQAIFEDIDPLICKVYKTQFIKEEEGEKGVKGVKGQVGFKGEQGPQGLQGNAGERGERGPDGPRGIDGNRGAQGSRGLEGPRGPTGPGGRKGQPGDPGFRGLDGRDGAPGPKGEKGQQGLAGQDAAAQGEKGNNGFGAPGRDGNRGSPGDQGLSGLAGSQGAKGDRGLTGEVGNTGRQGLFGEQGEQGQNGALGFRGQTGDKGQPGLPGFGAKGAKGEEGDNGRDGFPGLSGQPGSPGPKGEPGRQGNPGLDGEKGDIGERGRNGLPGSPGLEGDRGDPGAAGFGVQGQEGQKGESGVQGLNGANGADGLNGARGAKGRQGLPGLSGNPGIAGIDGIKGDRGDQGPVGPVGDKGVGIRGQDGRKGQKGSPGFDGQKGVKGREGGFGFKGTKGDKGLLGATGATGRAGPDGTPGLKGFAGAPGLNGQVGQSFVGLKGAKGFEGNPGSPGTPGRAGNNGIPGTPGAKGEAGDRGFNGIRGIDGNPGIDGTNGLPGDPGLVGIPGDPGRGLPGLPGLPGDNGAPGLRGDNGIPGSNGLNGEIGEAGANGVPGSPGIPGVVGDRGISGFPGSPGTPGVRGNTGATGFIGQQGNPGTEGRRGAIGDTGTAGTNGLQGPRGPKGVSGSSAVGPKGEQGPQGPKGVQGPPGAGGVAYVDECQSFNPCNQLCVDTFDSYYCACQRGYELSGQLEQCPPIRGKRKKRQADNCQSRALDIVLLIDNSAYSYDMPAFLVGVKTFLTDAGLCNGGNSLRIAIVTFKGDDSELVSAFSTETFDSVSGKLNAIQSDRDTLSTDAAGALQFVRNQLNGGQLQRRNQLVIALFTSLPISNLAAASTAAEALKAGGAGSGSAASIFAFGTVFATEESLNAIASEPATNFASFNTDIYSYSDSITSVSADSPIFDGGVQPPTNPPVTNRPPTDGECFGADLDIALLVDVTWWTGDFTEFKNSVSEVVAAFPSCQAERVRFAVVSFTTQADLALTLTSNLEAVSSSVENLPQTGGWDNDIGAALTTARDHLESQGNRDAYKIIMMFSAFTQDTVANQIASLKADSYTLVAYGFRRGAERTDWLSSVTSDPSLAFAAPDPDEMTLFQDFRPLVNNVRAYLDIEPPAPVGPNPLDLAIILDASGSLDANFDRLKAFAKDVIQNLNVGPNDVRIALVRFSQTAVVEWGLTRYSTLQQIERAFDNVRRIGGRTNIAAALRVTDKLVFEAQGRNNVPWEAIIITDGYANEEVSRTVYDASVLRESGVHILGVQVVDVQRLGAVTVPLESLATRPEYVYKYGSYVELNNVIRRIDVQNGIVRLAYVEYDVAPQPDDYYCRSTHHGLVCFCRQSPYRPINGSFCVDVNECAHHNGGCEQTCQNADGSFTCACDNGYVLADDRRSCLDVNECEGDGVCPFGNECINHIGGFICVEPDVTDPSTGAMVGAVSVVAVTPGVIIAISLSAAVGSVALVLATALAGRAIYQRRAGKKTAGGGEEESGEQQAAERKGAGGTAYGTVRSKLSMSHNGESKSVL